MIFNVIDLIQNPPLIDAREQPILQKTIGIEGAE